MDGDHFSTLSQQERSNGPSVGQFDDDRWHKKCQLCVDFKKQNSRLNGTTSLGKSVNAQQQQTTEATTATGAFKKPFTPKPQDAIIQPFAEMDDGNSDSKTTSQPFAEIGDGNSDSNACEEFKEIVLSTKAQHHPTPTDVTIKEMGDGNGDPNVCEEFEETVVRYRGDLENWI